MKYKVDLIGWPFPNKFVCPSSLSKSLPIVTKVFEALQTNTCKFVQLTADELEVKKNGV